MARSREQNTNTESVDHYLNALFHLSGGEKQTVSRGELAERLEVAPASATNMIEKLAAAKPEGSSSTSAIRPLIPARTLASSVTEGIVPIRRGGNPSEGPRPTLSNHRRTQSALPTSCVRPVPI